MFKNAQLKNRFQDVDYNEDQVFTKKKFRFSLIKKIQFTVYFQFTLNSAI